MSTKVTPKPKFKMQGVDFASLSMGDYFLHDDSLLVKTSVGDQRAVDVKTGIDYCNLCGEYVRPVDVEIKWKRKQ